MYTLLNCCLIIELNLLYIIYIKKNYSIFNIFKEYGKFIIKIRNTSI
jgi:hypothetical protein